MGADDLEDDFELVTVEAPDDASDNEGVKSKKRKKTGASNTDDTEKTTNANPDGAAAVFDGATGEWVTAAEVSAENKRKKRKQDRKKRSEKFQKKQSTLKEQLTAGSQGAATVIQQFLYAKFSETLTSVELAEIVLTDEHFVVGSSADTTTTNTTTTDSTNSTTNFDSATDTTNTTSDVSPVAVKQPTLDVFLKDIMKDTAGFAPPKKTNGAPRVLIVCQSAIRCVEVCRLLADLKIGKIGKLFGKHKQQSQQAYFLKNTSFSCAIGTPSRIGKLVADGSLNLTHCCRCVFDATYQDSKQRTLFEQPDVRRDLLGLLRTHVIKTVKASEGSMKLAVF